MKQRAHVLVVDDQADNLLILEDALSDLYEVHPAMNGREALHYLNEGGHADLILLFNGPAVKLLDSRAVGDIIQKGGTFLGTARSEEFKTLAGRQQAAVERASSGWARD